MTRRTLAVVLLIPFLILTLYAILKVGYWEIFNYQLRSPAGWQVLADLVIACILVLSYMVPDARRRGHNPWPWMIATLFLGSISLLAYMVYAGVNKSGK